MSRFRALPLVLIACVAIGCEHNSGSDSPDMAMSTGDDMAIGDGGGAGDDLAGMPANDLGGGGSAPDLANETCIPSGVAVVSQQTRPRMTLPLSANNGSATMVLWSVFPGAQFAKAVFAELQNGAVIASGDLPFGSDTSAARLYVFQSTFYAYHSGDKKLYKFDGTTWSAVLTVDAVAIGTTKILGLTGPGSSGPAKAVFWDGSSASTAQQISTNGFIGVASDDAGGFGVVTINGTTLRFMTYDGNAWSTESTVGTATIPFGNSLSSVSLAHAGTLWCFDYSFFSNNWTAWVGSGSTWSSTSPGTQGIGGVLANNGTFAISASDGKVFTYQSGAWTSTQVGSGGAIGVTRLAAFGSGYVYLDAPLSGAFNSWFFDGTQWSGPSVVMPGPTGFIQWLTMAVSGSTIALGVDLNNVVTYEAGSWHAPFTVTTSTPANVGPMAVAVQGNDVIAVYPDPGLMMSRTRAGGTWGSPVTLPASPSSGPVSNATIGRARNGHVLAMWTQWDGGIVYPYASEFDGCAWGAPTVLTGFNPGIRMAVAANGSTFLVYAYNGAYTQVVRWTGSGGTTPMMMGNGDVRIASDGATFVAVWSDTSGNLVSSTSADGQTWTTAQQVEAGPGWVVSDLVGGPAGVVETSYTSGGAANTHARIWKSAAWSAPTAMTVASPFTCKSSVGNSTALVLCSGNSSCDAELFAGGAWSDVPLSASISFGSAFSALASDGVDYRVDYGQNAPSSAVLHAGAWSTPAQGQTISDYTMSGLAGKSGAWMLTADTAAGDVFVARANGSAAYTTASKATLSPMQGPLLSAGIGNGWPGDTDVFWVGATPTWTSVQILYIGLGL